VPENSNCKIVKSKICTFRWRVYSSNSKSPEIFFIGITPQF
jgi:hypothetical protein